MDNNRIKFFFWDTVYTVYFMVTFLNTELDKGHFLRPDVIQPDLTGKKIKSFWPDMTLGHAQTTYIILPGIAR